MGYEIHFKPNEEVMKKYDKNILSFKDEILAEITNAVMKGPENGENFVNIYRKIKMWIKYLASGIKDEVYKEAYNSFKKDGTVWYSGWNYSHGCSDFEEDEYIKNTVEELALLANVVKTPDYFDENEKFLKKWNSVNEKMESFEDIMREIAIYEIINDLQEFVDNDEDENEEI